MSRSRGLVWDAESTRTMSLVAILLTCLALIGSWVRVGLVALDAEEPIAVRGMVVCLAFVVAGIGAGVLWAGWALWYARRRGRAVPGPGAEHMGLLFLLMGLTVLASGVERALQPTPTGWALFSLLLPSVGAGALIGSALVWGGRGEADGFAGGVPSQHGARSPGR